MGTINHNAIIATAGDKKLIPKIKKWIKTQPENVQKLFVFAKNQFGDFTVVMTPDGSKEGWTDSQIGDSVREQFKAFLSSFDHDDGSNPFDWIEVSFGEYGQKIIQGNCKNQFE